ncbi:hypothetical protein ACFSR2_19135 [Emticicia soli]|uniref:Uncharacterized protein n=1 Tax=Emticicia soli TaxID=2027878 RepID=A0ABW5JAB0_9BACT
MKRCWRNVGRVSSFVFIDAVARYGRVDEFFGCFKTNIIDQIGA